MYTRLHKTEESKTEQTDIYKEFKSHNYIIFLK